MKFVMNGCLILGTMDGANVEIAEEIGKENMFDFGKNVEEVDVARNEMYDGKRDYIGKRLARVFEVIKSGRFSGSTVAFRELIGLLEGGKDHYLVCHDFYFFTEFNLDCTESMIGLSRGWIFLEIMIFYFSFAGNIMFLFFSYLLIKGSGL